MPRSLARTPPAWATAMVCFADELLVEQAQLEKKAASAALTFLFKYPDELTFARPLAELAREELEHFAIAVAELESRGIARRRLPPSPYAERLAAWLRATEPERLLDALLVAAVIEARSAERMHLLAVAMRDREPRLAEFWQGLVASEARHQAVYLELARQRFGASVVEARFANLIEHEAAVLQRAAGMPRLHDGVAPCA